MSKTMSQIMKPLPIRKVSFFKDSFWGKRLKVIQEVAIPYQWKALNDSVIGAEKSHAIMNFKIAAGDEAGEFYGRVFQDSDVYKWLEALSYSLILKPDAQMEKTVDELIDVIEKAQQPDGYLNTYYIINGIDQRWTNLRDNHELYCAGHLIEAAVAYFQATGKRKLLDIACRFADHIDSVFGLEPGKKRGYPGHEEIELALIKLYRTTGNERYLQLTKYFIDERGRQPHYFDIEANNRNDHTGRYDELYYQADVPVREQTDAHGHAVRAMYLYSALADLYAETGDKSLFETCKKLWKNVIKKRMYVTGGIGSIAFGEAFTFDYDLPNDIAYAETCAAIGLVLWANRMLQIDVDSEYVDVMERALYNGILSGISLDGEKYFYVNPLEVWPEACEKRNDLNQGRLRTTRQNWWGTACCPPNIARLITSLGQYTYSSQENKIFVHLYTGSEAEVEIHEQKVKITQKTNYPWDGDIQLNVDPEKEAEFSVFLRIPGWCKEAVLKVNGETLDIFTSIQKGYVNISRQWKMGDIIELTLQMPVERIRSNAKVRANAGKVALQRGPVVYCIEETDNGSNLADISLPKHVQFDLHFDNDLLEGVTVINTNSFRSDESNWSETLYSSQEPDRNSFSIKAIPYYTWANRGKGEMSVWIREGE